MKEGEKGNRESDRTREPRSGNIFSRRGGRDDGESWSKARQRRSFGPDDADRAPRTNGGREPEKDTIESKDGRTPQLKGFDSHRREGGRDGEELAATGRRNGTVRGRNEPTWYRDGDRPEGEEQEDKQDATKNRDWREADKGSRRGGNRDWNRTNKVEQDPEWMDEPEPESEMRSHTAEDLERWMRERHKADQKPPDSVQLSGIEQFGGHERSTSGTLLGSGFSKIDTPLVLDSDVDKFFGLWSEPKSGNGISPHETSNDKMKQDVPKSMTSKKSRFKGMFNPEPDIKVAEALPSKPPAPPLPFSLSKDSSSEDKEGFQRILQMLGGGGGGGGVGGYPLSGFQPESTQSTSQLSMDMLKSNTTFREHVMKKASVSSPIHAPQSRESTGLEGLIGPQSPREGQVPQNRDSEFLLNLLQQSGPDMSHLSQRTRTGNAPGILPFQNSMSQQRENTQQPTMGTFQPSFYDESRREDIRSRDKLNPNANMERREQRLPTSRMFDDSVASTISRQQYTNLPNNLGIPSGLQRPPGLEQAPPGYIATMQPQQRQNMIAPPPGFQNPIRNPNLVPPGLMPNIAGLNINSDRSIPYGIRQAGPGAPPAIPPPGFMGINGPPPGFPPMSMNQEGRMSPSGRMFYNAGMQRHPMDLYAESTQLGIAGRGASSGQYRRPE